MYKLKILSIGKTKESWLEDALQEYTKRLKSSMTFEWIFAKNLEELENLAEKTSSYIALDPQGIQLSSVAFAKQLHRSLLEGGSRLCFVIGGAEGLSSKIKLKASLLISLSTLTFTHQLTRLILLEQIYRATEIEKGSSYHK
jgi:23S rRNA (pseudouridine1915-N3)-methyltransferase